MAGVWRILQIGNFHGILIRAAILPCFWAVFPGFLGIIPVPRPALPGNLPGSSILAPPHLER